MSRAASALVVGCLLQACQRAQARSDSTRTSADSMGVPATEISTVNVRSRRDLVENSAAAMSATQPGVLFTINDSGNEAILYAVDTTGRDRGTWRVDGSTDVDWEATAIGPCARDPLPKCVYIGDVGDNDAAHPTRTIYRVAEPTAMDSSFSGEVKAERITYSYSDRKHDVEAMYVAPNGDMYLITKRALRGFARALRPALVFRIPANSWDSKTPVVSQLVDSLSVVPGSALLRTITDASLARDGRHLAVRTYSQVFIYATDSLTARVNHAVPAAVCNIVALGEAQGEGITWAKSDGRLVFSSEGHDAPLHLANCPLPR